MGRHILVVTILMTLSSLVLFASTTLPVFALTTIPVGSSPFGVAVDPTINTIYVTNSGDDTISVISGATNTVSTTISVGSIPFGVAANPTTNKIYTANNNDGTVSVIDGSTNTVTATISVGSGSDSAPVGIAVNPTTNKIYTANNEEGTVSVIDGSTNTVTATISVGSGITSQPYAITVDPTTNIIYVTSFSDDTVSEIDGSTNTVTTIISVGSGPQGIAVDKSTNTAYVSNNIDGTVSVIPIAASGITPTTVSISSSSPNPSTLGQSLTFTATVTPNTATGTIQFQLFGVNLGSPVTLSGGSATFTTSSLPVGTNQQITAVYSGDATHAGRSSDIYYQTVNPVTTTTTLSSSPNPSTYGQSVTFTATVSPPSATGTVQFNDLNTNPPTVLGTATLSAGQAVFTTSSLSPGTHQIYAIYSGDTNNVGSASSILTQTVNQITTTIILSSSANPSTYGQSVIFFASVSPSSATGTVTFSIDGIPQPPAILEKGHQEFTTSSLSVGTHKITATYSGDTDNTGSTSSILTQTVNQISATTTLSSSPNPSTYGQSVTFTATVSPPSATGTVQFNDLNTNPPTVLGTATLSGGNAIFVTSSLGGGSHIIVAKYLGDANYVGSTSPAVTQTVNGASTTTSLSSSASSIFLGQSVTFTAKVSPSIATGTVQFILNNANLGSPVTLSGGSATFTTSSLPVGTNQVTATYSGDANFNPSTSTSVTVTVSAVQTPFAEKNAAIATLSSLSPQKVSNVQQLKQAIKDLTKSVDKTLWQDDGIHLNTKKGGKVFDYEKESVVHLMNILKDGHESTSINTSIQNTINQVVGADKTISTVAIADASSSSGDKDDLSKALKEMSKAANDTEKGHYASAIGHYKKAWELAQKAVHDCKQKPKDKSSDDGNK